MKRALAVSVTLVVAVGSLACGDDASRTASAPGTTVDARTAVLPPPAPTPTIPPFPAAQPPLATAGWIVFHRGSDLWVGKLDGSTESPLVGGALGSQFAGVATSDDGRRVLYFTALTEIVGHEPMIDSGTLEVRRQALDKSASIETLTSFRISAKQVQDFRFRESDVSVSPDGQHLAFADETGLWLYDLATKTARRLLSNNDDSTCDDQSIGLCTTYRWPSWSPAGEWLVLTRIFHEGAVADFIRPLEPVTEYTINIGALGRAWSKDGLYICGPEGHLQVEGWAVVQPGESRSSGEDGATMMAGKHRDLDEELNSAGIRPIDRPITSCAWARDGRVALQYRADERGYDQRIAVLAPDGPRVAVTDSPLFQSGLVDWLPDQSGFIVVYGDGEGRPMSYIVLLDGSLHELALATDDVVAVLPE